MPLSLRACMLLLLITASLPSAADVPAPDTDDAAALAAVTRDLCHKEVAMLGESSTHGDGHTVSFKVQLVQRLIRQCGFDTVFFEASHYEFIHLNAELRAGHTITADEIGDAVGGLWKFDREFQPLLPFLRDQAQSRKVFLGGIDDQLGQLGQDYSNLTMVSQWTARLPEQRRQDCNAALHHRVYSDYSPESPYSPSDHTAIEACLHEVQAAIAAEPLSGMPANEQNETLSAAKRWLARDFLPQPELIVGRDRSMFQNFEWLRAQQPQRHKVILWSATVHIAKQGDPTWGDHTGANLGSLLHRKYGAQAFPLGFSALSGSYGQGKRQNDMPTPPSTSVEAATLQAGKTATAYAGPRALAARHNAPGAFFRHQYQQLDWNRFLDGVVIFRREWMPQTTRP